MASTTVRRPRRSSAGLKLRHIGLALLALASGYVCYQLWRLPSGAQVAALRTEPLKETALMRQRKAEALEKGRRLRLQWQPVPMGQIAPSLSAAVIASEDARFFEHDGVDLKEVSNAVRHTMASGGTLRGASTLTQQLAKNLWLSTDRSMVRKLKEALLASRLEQHLPKKRILELYLNAVEWGEGIFGIEAGAQAHFHKPARSLTLAESAALAALLPSPRKLPQLKEAWYQRARHALDRIAEEHLAPAEAIASARLELAFAFGKAPPPPSEPPAPEPPEIEPDGHEEPQLVEPPEVAGSSDPTGP